MEQRVKKAVTRQLILQSGLELFYKNGYHATSLDDILKAVDLTKGAFYYHFENKEDFFIHILAEIVEKKVYSTLIEPIENQEDPRLTIWQSMEKALDKAEANEKDYGFVPVNFLIQFNEKNPKITERLNNLLYRWKAALLRTLQNGKTNGFINRHLNNEAFATCLISTFMGIRTLMVHGNKKMLKYQFMYQLKLYFKQLDKTL